MKSFNIYCREASDKLEKLLGWNISDKIDRLLEDGSPEEAEDARVALGGSDVGRVFASPATDMHTLPIAEATASITTQNRNKMVDVAGLSSKKIIDWLAGEAYKVIPSDKSGDSFALDYGYVGWEFISKAYRGCCWSVSELPELGIEIDTLNVRIASFDLYCTTGELEEVEKLLQLKLKAACEKLTSSLADRKIFIPRIGMEIKDGIPNPFAKGDESARRLRFVSVTFDMAMVFKMR